MRVSAVFSAGACIVAVWATPVRWQATADQGCPCEQAMRRRGHRANRHERVKTNSTRPDSVTCGGWNTRSPKLLSALRPVQGLALGQFWCADPHLLGLHPVVRKLLGC